jgi:hypothetical protein
VPLRSCRSSRVAAGNLRNVRKIFYFIVVRSLTQQSRQGGTGLALALLNFPKGTLFNGASWSIFTSIARSLFSTDDNMATPCSVKAKGRYLECWPRFKITFCDLKARLSSLMFLGTWWRATRGSNPGPLVPETNALSTELVAHQIGCIWDTPAWQTAILSNIAKYGCQ